MTDMAEKKNVYDSVLIFLVFGIGLGFALIIYDQFMRGKLSEFHLIIIGIGFAVVIFRYRNNFKAIKVVDIDLKNFTEIESELNEILVKAHRNPIQLIRLFPKKKDEDTPTTLIGVGEDFVSGEIFRFYISNIQKNKRSIFWGIQPDRFSETLRIDADGFLKRPERIYTGVKKEMATRPIVITPTYQQPISKETEDDSDEN